MEPIRLHALPRRGFVQSLWLPLLISLGVHGLFLLILQRVPAHFVCSVERSLPIDTCIFASKDDFACTLDVPVQPQHFPIMVEDPPAVSNPPASAIGPQATGRTGTEDPPAATNSAASNSTGQPGSRGNGPTIFQVSGSGKSVVYVIDRSLSMGQHNALATAKRELLASLEQLPEAIRFQVICYNQYAEPLPLQGRTDLVPATATNKQQVAQLLEALRPAGTTHHLSALRRALSLHPDVIFFITDADEMMVQDIRAVTQQNQGRTAIHTIELSRVPTRSSDGPLAQLARSNRGSFRSVSLLSFSGEP